MPVEATAHSNKIILSRSIFQSARRRERQKVFSNNPAIRLLPKFFARVSICRRFSNHPQCQNGSACAKIDSDIRRDVSKVCSHFFVLPRAASNTNRSPKDFHV